MAQIKSTVCVLSIIACLQISDASLCKPYSEFKLDCNTCKCSSSGMEFSCSKDICAPLIYRDKYLIEQNEKGYTILKPKIENSLDIGKKRNSEDDLFVNDNVADDLKIKRGQRFVQSNLQNRLPYQTIDDGQDYVDDDRSPFSSQEIQMQDAIDSDDQEDDDGLDDTLSTWGRLAPQNRLY